ncbi:MAG: glycerophosphoryl diester phosphodiesterase membrane domain-containing protein [Lachnospiraceae bacterium]|nr:glycerophosphoryl diester phosphodiesterase membrane domain-containing protein [Lachnospiraceae bacterium]
MKEFQDVKQTFILIKRNAGGLIRYEILYKLMTFLIFFPLLEQMERLALRVAGVYYISNYNLRMVLRSPAFWAAMTVILLALAIFISLEFFGLSYGIHASYCRRKVTARQMFAASARMSAHILKPRNLLFLLYVFLILPLADFYEAFSSARNFSLPGYMVQRIVQNDRYKYLLLAAVIVLGILTLLLIYVIPSMTLLDESFFTSVKRSIHYTSKRFPKVILTAVLWLALIAAVFAAAFVGILAAIKLVVMWVEPSFHLKFSWSSPVVLVVESLLLLTLTWLLTPLILARIFTAFYHFSEDEEIPQFTREYGKSIRYVAVKITTYGLIALALYFFVPQKYDQIKTALLYGGRDTMIMAHRGDSVSAPENTLPAFRKAIQNGADAAELDVQLTKDGTVIVLHDSSLKRTTGLKKNVWEVTYDQIKDLDNGSFYDPKYEFTRIPTLDQVLKVCKGELYLNIEIKRTGHDAGIVEKTLEVISANHYEKDCDITSFDYDTLRMVKKINPEIYTVYTTTVGGGSLARLKDINAFSVEQNFVTAEFVQYMRSENKGIFVWTVDEPSMMNRMIDLNVDAIITNNVRLGRSMKKTNKGISGMLRRIQRQLLAF